MCMYIYICTHVYIHTHIYVLTLEKLYQGLAQRTQKFSLASSPLNVLRKMSVEQTIEKFYQGSARRMREDNTAHLSAALESILQK